MFYVQLDFGNDGAYVAELNGSNTELQKCTILACLRYPYQRAEFSPEHIAPRYPYAEGTVKYVKTYKPYAYTTLPTWRNSVITALKKAMIEAKASGDQVVYQKLMQHKTEMKRELAVNS